MNPSLENILKKNYVDGALHTHVSMVQPRGKFQFNRNNLEDFWDSYYAKLKSEKEPIIGIAEKPQHYLPVLADIDIKIKDEGGDYGDHLYTPQQITKVIEISDNFCYPAYKLLACMPAVIRK